MIWRKSIVQENYVWVLSTLVVFFCIFGFLFKTAILFFVGLLFGTFMFLNYLYDKYSGKDLELENIKKRQRFFVGDEGNLELHFTNKGFPILNGQLEVYFNKNITGKFSEDESELHRYQNVAVRIPLTIKNNQQLLVKVPFRTTKRGIGRVTRIAVTYQNLFGFSKVLLDYSPVWNEEFIIYPTIETVDQINLNTILKEGHQISNQSLFEDRLLMAGTRDYFPTDSFQNIHWKASAKLNRLQTKVFEKITDTSLLIVINAAEGYWINSKIEEILSRIAYIAEVAYKKNISISVITNIKTHGETPFLYVPFGEGKEHYIKILEMLAVIDTHQLIVPYEKLLYYIFSHRMEAPYMIHAGLINENQGFIYKNIAKRGSALYKLMITDDYSSVVAL